MGIFSRRQRDATTISATAQDKPGIMNKFGRDSHTSPRTRKGPLVMNMSTRPSFGQWLKVTWLDLITMVIMGVIGLGVYEAHPAPSRSFPVYFQDGEIVYPQFAYPMRNEIVPIWAAALLGSLVPIAVILICQIRIRSFWDVNNAVIGLLYSLITAAVFQVFLKWLIGGLRPHFLTVCKPNIPPIVSQESGNGLRQIMYDRTICTGNEDEIDDSLESFPSGHSTAAFAGFVYLYLYLNAKLKVWSNYHPAMWKLIATYAPILGATLIAGALTIDEFHNWYDCLAGAIIGTVMAFSAYRMVYASIWDWRVNHIPLNRAVPFSPGEAELSHAVFTRQAGWGLDEGAYEGNGHGHMTGNADIAQGGNSVGYGGHNAVNNGANEKSANTGVNTGVNDGYGNPRFHSNTTRKPIGGSSSGVRGDSIV